MKEGFGAVQVSEGSGHVHLQEREGRGAQRAGKSAEEPARGEHEAVWSRGRGCWHRRSLLRSRLPPSDVQGRGGRAGAQAPGFLAPGLRSVSTPPLSPEVGGGEEGGGKGV